MVCVPFHAGKDIKRGIVHRILTDAEISREEFQQLR